MQGSVAALFAAVAPTKPTPVATQCAGDSPPLCASAAAQSAAFLTDVPFTSCASTHNLKMPEFSVGCSASRHNTAGASRSRQQTASPLFLHDDSDASDPLNSNAD
eukprot:2994164-Pleurochrysis_carterae.AAC.1